MPQTGDEFASKMNLLQLLRLSIGVVESPNTHPPTDEEKELVEKSFVLRNLLSETLDGDTCEMLVAMVAVTQLLEDILCQYGEDMPDVLTAIFAKLAQHGTQHMDLTDNPLKEITFKGTVH